MTDVPCNGCTACCRNDLVFLHPEEGDDLSLYQWEWADNPVTKSRGPALRHKKNRECIHLAAGGCSVHDHAPVACRKFDCRALYRTMMALPRPDRRRFQRHVWGMGLFGKDVIAAAKARLEA